MKKFISKVLIALTLSGVTFNNYSKAGWTGNPMTSNDIENTWNHLWNDVFTKDSSLNFSTSSDHLMRSCRFWDITGGTTSSDQLMRSCRFWDTTGGTMPSDQLMRSCRFWDITGGTTSSVHLMRSHRFWDTTRGTVPYSDLVEYLKKFNVSSWVCLEFSIYLADYLNQNKFLSALVIVRDTKGKRHMMVLSAYKDEKSGMIEPMIFNPYPAFVKYSFKTCGNAMLNLLKGLPGISADEFKMLHENFFTSTPINDLLNKYTTNLKRYLVYGSNRTLYDVLCDPKSVNEVVIIDSSINPNVPITDNFFLVETLKEKKGYFDFRDFMLEKFPHLKTGS